MDLVSQNLLLTSGGKKDSTYVDDVFSTYLYKGNGTTQTIDNGLKLGNSNAGNSVYFNGTGQLEIASTSDFAFGTGNYTVEFWINYSTVTNYMSIFEGRPTNSNGQYFSIQINGGQLQVYINSVNQIAITVPAANQWHHIAVVREGTGTNQLKLYVNGSATTGQDTANYGNQRCLIAGHAWSRGSFYGSLSNYRVTKGQALYTSNFTPSTEALTSTSQGATASNVKLLCCQSSTSATDATISPSTISETGSVKSHSFGPFTVDDGEGGLVWIKSRTNTYSHIWQDTVNGTGKFIKSNSYEPATNTSQYITSFNNSGYSLGFDNDINNGSQYFSSWAFRKSKGFFDIVSWTGNDNGSRQIAHNLECQPGLIILKNISRNGTNWMVWHKDIGATEFLELNASSAKSNDPNLFGGSSSTSPTSTNFTIGGGESANKNGDDFIAYLFAGGASDEPGAARSVDFDGTDDKLSIADHADLRIGSSTYTMEFWVYKNADTPDNWDVWAAKGSNSNNTREWAIESFTDQRLEWWYATSGSNWNYFVVADRIETGQWTHICAQKDSSGYFSFFVNGVRTYYSTTGAQTLNTGPDAFCIGGFADTNNNLDCNIKVSNFRFIKGTALYSSSFRPSTTGLTDITNTKLLCCNKNTVTGSTVTPSTITSLGNPQSSTSTPFDDPAGFKFGEGGDQNIIECGSYQGNGSTNGPEINLGWEPSFLIIKNITDAEGWVMFDQMRGMHYDVDDKALFPNQDTVEQNRSTGQVRPTPLGFKMQGSSDGKVNGSNKDYVFLAVRKVDGYVGKPAEVGTDVFSSNLATTNAPWFKNNTFPVDVSIHKRYDQSEDWYQASRLQGTYGLRPSTTSAEANITNYWKWDYMDGWNSYTSGTSAGNYISYQFKCHAGFDLGTYTGNGVSPRSIPHNLGRSPEMIWTKGRNSTYDWKVWHMGLTGGGATRNLSLNTTDAQSTNSDIFGGPSGLLPTSTHYTVGSNAQINQSGTNQIYMLFASIKGISKCGSYDGSSSTVTVTTGFQPRFVIIKRIDVANDWYVLDTVRGWSSGVDQAIKLNVNQSQFNSHDLGAPTSTGFTVASTNEGWNTNGGTYIYYAHA